LSSLAAIISFGCISQVQAATCISTGGGNWSTVGIWNCGHVPTIADDAQIEDTVTLDQDVTVKNIPIMFGTLNAGSHTITLTGIYLIQNQTFNYGTSTVKISDADHILNTNLTFYNLQWATPLTAPRTMTINSAITIATGGAFSLGGSSSTNKVIFTGTGSVSPAVTLTNCTSTVTGINCGGGGAAVSAPIDLHFSKQVESYSTDIELK